jgi:hypothetical protein
MPEVKTTTSLIRMVAFNITDLYDFADMKLLSKTQICMLALYLNYGSFEVTLTPEQINQFLHDWSLKHSDLMALVAKLENKKVIKLDHENKLFSLVPFTEEKDD